MQPAPRVVAFEGAHNFRDLGGYPTAHNGRVRTATVYRAGRLDGFTAADLDQFARLGIETVIDLRREEERAAMPDPVDAIHVCLVSGLVVKRPLPGRGVLIERDHGVQFMADLYTGLIAHAEAEIGTIFRLLAEPARLPAVFHCTAGKDRTGLIAALVLSALGVDRELVLDDFELTAQHVAHDQHEAEIQRMLERGMGPEAAAGMLATSHVSMQAALEHLDRDFGGIDRYLSDHVGLDRATLAALADNLIDDRVEPD